MKFVFFSLCKLLGLFVLFRFLNRKKTVVLTYHSVVASEPPGGGGFEYRNCVSMTQFERQLRLLKQKYRVAHPDHFLQKHPPPASFLITFDDGFKNNHSHAFPLLMENNLPALFFITTGFIGGRELLWTEKIIYLILNTGLERLELGDLGSFSLGSIEERISACEKIREVLKKSDCKRVSDFVDEIEKKIKDVSVELSPPERYGFLTWEQVKEMTEGGMTIGSHTRSHFLLSSLNDEMLRSELEESKKDIENHTGRPCDHFSYPNGARGDFGERDKRFLRKLGYRCAFSQLTGLNDGAADSFEIKRVNITSHMDIVTFEAHICGFADALKRCLANR